MKSFLVALMAVVSVLGIGNDVPTWAAESSTACDDGASPHLAAIGKAMAAAVEAKEIAGAVTLVADGEKILHQDATGLADRERNEPLRADSIFWIASMTKPVTATAVMMLVDEGKLSIDDPVGKYLPGLGQLKTRDGQTHVVTIKHLLTHTSGMGELSVEESKPITELAGIVPLIATKPLAFEPGSSWRYCQSGINTAARVVEVISGKSFVDFLDERLFQPLGMKDTTFYLSEDQAKRLATSYTRTQAGELEPAAIFILLGHAATSRQRFPATNGGLFSTAGDYVRFCQMILNRGTLGGRRFLSEKAVEQMTTLQSGELKTGFTEGCGWGLGWCLVRTPQGPSGVLSPGSFGHGGAYGTQAWIDPTKKRIYLLLVQRANFENSDASDVRTLFQKLAAAELD